MDWGWFGPGGNQSCAGSLAPSKRRRPVIHPSCFRLLPTYEAALLVAPTLASQRCSGAPFAGASGFYRASASMRRARSSPRAMRPATACPPIILNRSGFEGSSRLSRYLGLSPGGRRFPRTVPGRRPARRGATVRRSLPAPFRGTVRAGAASCRCGSSRANGPAVAFVIRQLIHVYMVVGT